MHHMKRDWEKNITYYTKKNPSSPVYYFSPRQKTSITLPSNLIGGLEDYLSTGSL